jgi:hypothetical protein
MNNSTLQVFTASTERLRIDSNGNVGIGNVAPAEKLHVNGDAVIGAANTDGNLYIRKRFDGTAGLNFQRTTAGTPVDASVFCDQFENLNISWNQSADISNQALFFKSNNVEAMRIEASGKVGIGVSSGLGGVLTLPHQESLSFHDAGGSARKVLEFDTGELKHGSAGAGLSTQTFFTGGTERVRIDTNGNLLIGTTAVGTASGDNVVVVGSTYIVDNQEAIAASGTSDISINTGGGGYTGTLTVSNVVTANAGEATYTTFFVSGRGAAATIQQIATDNGASGSASFTVTTPTNGVIRVTNTSGSATTVSISFVGHFSL